MRSLALPALLLTLGCGSSEANPPAADSGTVNDTSSSGETSNDGGADFGVDAPDYSTVNPLEGVPTVSKLAGGFAFTEGTTWNAAGGFLLFTDIPGDTIHKLTPPMAVTEHRKPSGKANGLGWDPAGLLITCEHENRRVARINDDGSATTLADRFEGKRLNSPNDSIVRSDGTIYFSDPDYGLEGRPREVAFKGVYRISPTGALSLVDKDMNQPNGLALSPDEKTLYVSDSAANLVNKWTVNPDGTVTGKSKLTDTGGGGDGMAIDDAGNLYVTTNAGVKVYQPDGTSWGTLSVPEVPANCAFGGADRKTLYIAARTSIYRVVLGIPGRP